MARSAEQFADQLYSQFIQPKRKSLSDKDRPPMAQDERERLVRFIKGYLHEQEAVKQKNQLTLF